MWRPSIGFGWKKHAGLICFNFYKPGWTERTGRELSIHIFVRRSHWVWGYVEDWYDGPLRSFGAGPLFLFAWY